MNLQQIEDFELPNGGIYTGECINNYGFIELCGQGETIFPNGDKYVGLYKHGRPYGFGTYKFSNGHYHKGYFDNLPCGPGYLSENYDMAFGFFLDGKLNGWGIKLINGKFVFGFWENGRLIHDETNTTLWIRAKLTQDRNTWNGNLIQYSKEEFGYIRLGYPERKVNSILGEMVLLAMGFQIFKDGRCIAGTFKSNDGKNGEFAIYYPNRTIKYGYFVSGEVYRHYELQDLQYADEYLVEGINVF